MADKIEIKYKIKSDRILFNDGSIVIQNFFGHDRTYKLENSRKEFENYKPNDVLLELKLNEFVLFTPEPIHKLIENIKELLENSLLKDNAEQITIDPPFPGYQVFDDWSKLELANRSIYFNNIKLDCIDSKAIYNPFINHFTFNKVKYYVRFKGDEPVAIRFTENVFDFLELGHRLFELSREHNYLSHSNIYKLISKINSSTSLDNYLIEKALLDKNKTNYFRYLNKIQDDNARIRLILEPTKVSGNIIGYDLSFLFTKKYNNYYFAIWESAELEKATYIFCFPNFEKYQQGVLHFEFLLSNVQSYVGRLELRNNPDPKLGEMRIINHNNQTNLDDEWKTNLNIIISGF